MFNTAKSQRSHIYETKFPNVEYQTVCVSVFVDILLCAHPTKTQHHKPTSVFIIKRAKPMLQIKML